MLAIKLPRKPVATPTKSSGCFKCTTSIKKIKIHFVSAPGLAWDGALRISGIELELLNKG